MLLGFKMGSTHGISKMGTTGMGMVLDFVLNAGLGAGHWGWMFSGFRTRPDILGVHWGLDCGFSLCTVPTY